MTLPSVEELDPLSREELLALVKTLLNIIDDQQRRITELESELAKSRQPPVTSTNSSQPPSRDQKTKLRPKHRKKHGPPIGHPKYTRVLVDNPDRVILAPVTQCLHCHADLSQCEPEQVIRRQLTELPVVKPVIIETQQHQVCCPHCQTLNQGELPAGLEADRYFGPELEAKVVYYKQLQHMSYERTVGTLHDLHGVDLSEGAIAAILARAGTRAAPLAESIRQTLGHGGVVKSDETSARVKGENWWQWVFVGMTGVYHTIVPTRSGAEIATVMGERQVDVWVSDCLGTQLTAPAREFQLCLAHQLRDLQRIIDVHPRSRWARAVQRLFREAIHLHHRFFQTASLTLTGYQRRVTQIENQLDRLLAMTLTQAEAIKLQQRLVKHREKLLTFLYSPDVPPTNNESEQALRGSVIHRKVTNGFRSEWGAKAYAALQSVIATAKLNGESVLQALVNLMGIPVLPFLSESGP
jgi:transposase